MKFTFSELDLLRKGLWALRGEWMKLYDNDDNSPRTLKVGLEAVRNLLMKIEDMPTADIQIVQDSET